MEQETYLTASSFEVKIEGMTSTQFETVSGLGISIEDISFQGKGNYIENRPGRSNATDITFTRRFRKDPELFAWLKDIKNGKFNTKSGSVILLNDEGKEVVRFNFEKAWPKIWNPPVLSKGVGGNDTPMETIVLSVQNLEIA